MKLIIGLGNPGKKYHLNRHNVGHMAIDFLKKANLSKTFILKKSNLFMNQSGPAVKHLVSQHGNILASNLYIIHDDLDIRLGEYKIQKGTGPKDHKGLNSIYKTLSSKDFWHVRLGVDNREPDNRTPGEEYVLQNFASDELKTLKKVFLEVSQKL